MRILRIAGENLASLKDRFEIDLEHGVLGEAGIVAISGPTGSGKTTLLDAICLALFDRVPRYDGKSGELVGDETLGIRSNDVRSVLRRGCGQASAEVGFIGADGRRYTARWVVHRAHKKASGSIQAQQMSLVDDELGPVAGGKKTEVKQVIAEKLGLTYDQFLRSVLLAQGDFARFLEADDDVRSELLEKMTGTEIYSRLSQAAFERHKAAAAELASKRVRQADLALLGPETREALERELDELGKRLDAARAERESIAAALAWHVRLDELLAAAAEAERDALRTDQAWQAAAERRGSLDRARKALPLLGRHAAVQSREAERDETRAHLGQAEERAREAALLAERSESLLSQREQALQTARQAWDDAGPQIALARGLDAELRSAESSLAELHARAAEARDRSERDRGAASEAGSRLAALRAALERADGWLDDHEDERRAEADWDACQADMAQLEDASAGLEAAALERDAAGRLAARARSGRDGHLAASERAAAGASEAAGALQAAKRLASGQSWTDLGAARESLERRRELARRAEVLADDARELSARLESLSERAARHRQAARAEQDRAGELGLAHEQAEREIGQLERELESARADGDLARLRGRLRPGEPCPVCGSSEHPAASAPLARAPSDRDLDALAARIRDRRSAALEHAQQRARAEQASEAEALRAREADAEIAAAEAERRQLRASWTGLRSEIGEPDRDRLPARPDAEPAADGVRDLLSDLDESAAALAELHRQIEARDRAIEQASEEMERARLAEQAARAELAQASEALHRAEQVLAEAERTVERASLARQAAADRLGRLLREEAWRSRLADPAGLRVELGAAVASLRERRAERDAIFADIGRLEPELAMARAEAERSRDDADRLEADCARSEERLAAQREARAGLLGGMPADAFAGALEQARRDAEQSLDAARQERDSAREQRVGADRSVQERGQHLARVEREIVELRAVLEREIEGSGIEPGELEALAARGTGWMEAEREALDALQHARNDARSVLAERERQRAAHEGAGRPALARSDAERRAEALSAELDGLQQRFHARAAARKADDDARALSARIASEIDAEQQKLEIWARLNELIGSSSGKKFRRFAQGLTLDGLLDEANAHLVDLAPRFRLERTPGTELHLQLVDRYMGDEPHSANSLSGGERFLVSLALALGLSSMSAAGARIGSLFIDEGFGALDAETLDQALAVLDELQAGGRQVCLISHVPGLSDRIHATIEVQPAAPGRSRIALPPDARIPPASSP